MVRGDCVWMRRLVSKLWSAQRKILEENLGGWREGENGNGMWLGGYPHLSAHKMMFLILCPLNLRILLCLHKEKESVALT